MKKFKIAVIVAGLSILPHMQASAQYSLPGMGTVNEGANAFASVCSDAQMIQQAAEMLGYGVGAVVSFFSGGEASEPTQIIGHLSAAKQRICANRTLIAQFRQQLRTADALVGSRDVMGFARNVARVGRNYMPRPGEVAQGIGRGRQGIGRAQEYAAEDMYADPENSDGMIGQEFWQEEMERRRIATANIKEVAYTGMEDMEDRIYMLEQQAQRVADTRDITEVANLQALIQTSSQNLQTHQANLQNVQLMIQAEERAAKQRQNEYILNSAVRFNSGSREQWGGGIR